MGTKKLIFKIRGAKLIIIFLNRGIESVVKHKIIQ